MGKLYSITKALKNTISEPTARPSLTLSVNLTWMFDSWIQIQRLTWKGINLKENTSVFYQRAHTTEQWGYDEGSLTIFNIKQCLVLTKWSSYLRNVDSEVNIRKKLLTIGTQMLQVDDWGTLTLEIKDFRYTWFTNGRFWKVRKNRFWVHMNYKCLLVTPLISSNFD